MLVLTLLLFYLPSCFAQDVVLSLNDRNEVIFSAGSIKSIGNILIIQNGNEIRAISVGNIESQTYKEIDSDYLSSSMWETEPPQVEDYWDAGMRYERSGQPEKALEAFQCHAEKEKQKGNYGAAAWSYILAAMPEKANEMYQLAAEECEQKREWAKAAFYYQKLGMKDKYKEIIEKNNLTGGQP